MKTTLFTSIALIALLLAGCSGDGDISGVSESAQAADLATLPTETELQIELGLSDTQAEAMAVLLGNWRRDMQNGESAEPGQGRRLRGEHRMIFLEEATGILDREQFLQLVNHLAERRDAMQGQGRPLGGPMAGGRGPGMGHGHGGNDHGIGQGANDRPGQGDGPRFLLIFEELDLSEEQRTAIRTWLEEYRESHEPPEQGNPEARREFMQQMREDMREFLQTVLDEDQLDELDSLHAARRLERIAVQLENLDERFERRVEFLTTVLQLDDGQSGAFAELSESAAAAIRALLEDADENTDFDALREELRTLRDEMDAALRALLDTEQLEILDALAELMHRGPGH